MSWDIDKIISQLRENVLLKVQKTHKQDITLSGSLGELKMLKLLTEQKPMWTSDVFYIYAEDTQKGVYLLKERQQCSLMRLKSASTWILENAIVIFYDGDGFQGPTLFPSSQFRLNELPSGWETLEELFVESQSPNVACPIP